MSARGERVIEVDGREVGVLFTNRALMDAEKRLGRGIIAVAEGFANGSAGITEIAILLLVGMEAHRVAARLGGRPVSMTDVYEVLDEAGFTGVAGPVMEAVAAVIGYSPDGEAGAGEDDSDPNA